MNSDSLRIASISDIHLGHHNTTTMEILANLRRAFPDNEITGELDLIFIVGDVFDRLLQLPDNNALEIKFWINQFLRMCARRDIVVRVLEGTPSHDWGQSRLFTATNEVGEINADLKYIDRLDIDYIERFGITVLCIPDEWLPETDDIWKEVQRTLKQHGLKQVDFALMHGCFKYQLPAHVQVPRHEEERYLSIVRHYILIGHHHKHSMHERIIAQGSFDRLSHNEEEPKGHVRLTLRATGDDDIVFVENKHAKVYHTIDCRGLDIEAAFNKVKADLDHPEGSFLRIRANREDPIMSAIDVLRGRYPQFNWSPPKVDGGVLRKEDIQQNLKIKYDVLNITPNNIEELIMERIKKRNVSRELQVCCERLLNGVIG